MADQRVVVSLFANNASYLAQMTAATGATDKLRVSVDGLGKQMVGVAAGADAATAGTSRLGKGAAGASTEVANLGRSSAGRRRRARALGVGAEVAGAKVGSAMRLAAKSVPLVAVVAGAEFAKMAGDFQQETNVLVTAAGESQAALGTVRKGILDIAQNTGTRWQDVTDGMYQIEKAGYRGGPPGTTSTCGTI